MVKKVSTNRNYECTRRLDYGSLGKVQAVYEHHHHHYHHPKPVHRQGLVSDSLSETKSYIMNIISCYLL